MTTPVNFEIAKLLKEKGFDEPCYNYYISEYNGHFNKYNGQLRTNNILDGVGDICGEKKRKNYKTQPHIIIAPTIAEVVMWLYEKHGIWISIDMIFEEAQTGFWYCIRESKIDDVAIQSEEFNSPTEAYEAGIDYTLNNLI